MLQVQSFALFRPPCDSENYQNFSFLSQDKFPSLSASWPCAFLLWLTPDLNQLPLELLHCLKNICPSGLTGCRHVSSMLQGLFSALERYKIYSVPLSVGKPVSKQDLEITQQSIYWVCRDTAVFHRLSAKESPWHLLEQKGLVRSLGGFLSGRCVLVYTGEKKEVPR